MHESPISLETARQQLKNEPKCVSNWQDWPKRERKRDSPNLGKGVDRGNVPKRDQDSQIIVMAAQGILWPTQSYDAKVCSGIRSDRQVSNMIMSSIGCRTSSTLARYHPRIIQHSHQRDPHIVRSQIQVVVLHPSRMLGLERQSQLEISVLVVRPQLVIKKSFHRYLASRPLLLAARQEDLLDIRTSHLHARP